MHGGPGKRTCPTHGVPNRYHRGGEDNERGRRLSQSHRRDDDHTENDVLEGMLTDVGSKPAAEHDLSHHRSANHEEAGFAPLSSRPCGRRTRRRQNCGREYERSERVA